VDTIVRGGSPNHTTLVDASKELEERESAEQRQSLEETQWGDKTKQFFQEGNQMKRA
jgi:hypothetical protein